MTYTANQTQSTQLKIQKRVRFVEEDDVHMIPEDEIVPDTWYGAEEMRLAFRADVIAFLKEFRRSQLREETGDDSDRNEEEKEPICSRGLEMYFPGEIALRKRVRAIFYENVLKKYRDLMAIFEDTEVVGEYLQQFASALGQTAQKKAHALALQDALEARIVYAEGLEERTTKDPAALEFVPLIKHESKTELITCKARAA